MIINISYGASASGVSTAFRSTVDAVVQFLQAAFVDPITINIQLDSGEIQGEALPEGALAASLPDVEAYSYAQIRSALTADATSSNDVSSTLFLPASNPAGAGTWYLTSANARAIGLAASPPGGIDGYIGVANDVAFDFDPSNGVSAGAFDLFAVIVHEITHIMGRILGGGAITNGTPSYAELDLFKYKQDGTLALSETAPGYVSLDGASGYNELYDLNTDLSATTSDWAVSVGNDAFVAIANPGVVLTVSPNDIALMDAIGYNLANPPLGDLTTTSIGQATLFAFRITNTSNFVAPTLAGLFLSVDATITNSDTLIGTVPVGFLFAGEVATLGLSTGFPSNLTPGKYYFGVIANYNGAGLEATTANNASGSTPVYLGNDLANALNVGLNDIVYAFAGDDTINVADPFLGGAVQASFDGGTGFDTLLVSRNDQYPAFAPSTLKSIERFAFADGRSYSISPANGLTQIGVPLIVDASALGSGYALTFDGSQETAGGFAIQGGAGADQLTGGAGNDTINGGEGGDSLTGGIGDDALSGAIGNDTLSGGAGNDILDGGAGTDVMAGGSGNDIYIVDSLGDAVTENSGDGTDTVQTALTSTLSLELENLTLTGAQAIDGTGNSVSNSIVGNSASNTLTGGAGNDYLYDCYVVNNIGSSAPDTLVGGVGDDTYLVTNALDVILENPGEGTDKVECLAAFTLPANVENLEVLRLPSPQSIQVAGNDLPNQMFDWSGGNIIDGKGGDDWLRCGGPYGTLIGGDGNDTLECSNTGDGTLIGGSGDDTYIVGWAGDRNQIIEDPGEGIDTIRIANTSWFYLNYVLGANIEALIADPFSWVANVTGNSLDNTIEGSFLDNVLSGLDGNDTLYGGGGNDTLIGGQGADRLDGGAVTFTGVGNPINTASYASSPAGVTAYLDGSVGVGGDAQGDTLFNINGLVGSAFLDTLNGNTGNDYLQGSAGNDMLDGRSGTDTAVFSSVRSAYMITRNGATTTVVGPDGADTLTAIERAQFSDQTINVDRRIGDTNADGNADILWQTSAGVAAIWLMNGLQLLGGDIVGPNPGPTWHIAGNGDYSGDGKADILWRTDTGIAAIWLMDGLRLLGGDSVGPNPGTTWNIAGSGDFDGDGKSDILWQTTAGVAAVWLMDGLRLLGGDIVGPNPGPTWHIKSAADFNGDGKADILWETDSHQVGIWLMDGLRLLGGDVVGPAVAADWHIKAAGDFNGDGKSDILWQTDAGQAAIWLMDGLRLLGGDIVGPTVAADWHIKGAEDLNGDGKSDILWQAGNGQPAAWLIDGLRLLGGDLVGPNPGTTWHVIAPTG